MISSASRNFAAGVFIVGMLLIGFGFLVWVLRELFAILAAIIFCIAGIGCIGTAVRIFLASRRMDKEMKESDNDYRRNVRIHHEDDFDF